MASKPGSGTGSAGAPGDFQFEKFERLSQNPQINRMPRNDFEWAQFVHELEKYSRNESDGFVPTFVGFSSDPSDPFVWYQRFGQIVMLQFHFDTGTSNSVSFYIDNLPEHLTPYTKQVISPVPGLVDNSGEVEGSIRVNPNGTVTFSPDQTQASNWTTSNDKGILGSPSRDDQLSIVYFLRKPNKI